MLVNLAHAIVNFCKKCSPKKCNRSFNAKCRWRLNAPNYSVVNQSKTQPTKDEAAAKSSRVGVGMAPQSGSSKDESTRREEVCIATHCSDWRHLPQLPLNTGLTSVTAPSPVPKLLDWDSIECNWWAFYQKLSSSCPTSVNDGPMLCGGRMHSFAVAGVAAESGGDVPKKAVSGAAASNETNRTTETRECTTPSRCRRSLDAEVQHDCPTTNSMSEMNVGTSTKNEEETGCVSSSGKTVPRVFASRFSPRKKMDPSQRAQLCQNQARVSPERGESAMNMSRGASQSNTKRKKKKPRPAWHHKPPRVSSNTPMNRFVHVSSKQLWL